MDEHRQGKALFFDGGIRNFLTSCRKHLHLFVRPRAYYYFKPINTAYVDNDSVAKNHLYHEPERSDKEIAAYEKLMQQINDTIPEPLRKATEMEMPTDQEIQKIQQYMQSLDKQ
ncbi:hypothetical protein Q4603_21540 [Zobellia galactanivorans]|uniref:hypothetical protein n=1 Tax=Zobellia galactanivorans (strain DSM 12802 / CCUG 47099 / CIP 106680 / NCIMB 13871 / Dsij) TaxID=63186 RepID=UPI0026E1AEA7|nr:hypothetical protein [Zobellia galactanivorans]MDO6811215.1 hypothetical protein [Zobellia galactanivorans]